MNQTGLKLIWVVLRWPQMTSNQNEHLLEGWVTIKILTEKVFPAQDRHASLQEDWEWFYTRMEEPGEERRGEVLSKIFLLSKVKAESESFVKSSILLIVYGDFCQCLRRPWGRKYSQKWINIEISSLLLQLEDNSTNITSEMINYTAQRLHRQVKA